MSAGEPSPDSPQLFRVFWRGSLFIALVAFFTASAMLMRALIGGFGWEPWTLAYAAGSTLVCGALVLPFAMVVEFPDAIFRHWLPERRFARGACPACGYSVTHAPTSACPECGAALQAPAPYTVTWRTLHRCVAIATPAWVLGCAIGLTLAVRDEHSFVIETQTLAARTPAFTAHSRPRAGLASFADLRWTIDGGFSSPPPFAPTRERTLDGMYQR